MSSRVKAFIVTLSEDKQPDEATAIADAIRLLRGVASVRQLERRIDDVVAIERAKDELRGQIGRLLG